MRERSVETSRASARARSPRFEGAREGEATGEGNARDVRDVRARIDQSIVDRIRWWTALDARERRRCED